MPYRQITHSLALSLFTALLLMHVSGTAAARTLKPIAQTESVSTIQRIRDRGNVLVAGVMYDFPPFGYEDDGGNLVGFDIELIRAIANSWGVQVEFVSLNADDRIPLLVAGEVDIVAAAMTHTQYRDEEIDFSQTYFLDRQGLLVRSDADITTLAELQNKRVAAIQGTTSLLQIASVAEMQAIDIEIVPFLEHMPALEALEGGAVEAFTTDQTTLSLFAERNPAFRVLGKPFSIEPYGFGIQSGDTLFRRLIDTTLQELKNNGTYEQLYEKWFPTLTPYVLAPSAHPWPYSFSTSPATIAIPERSAVESLLRRNQFTVGVNSDAALLSSLDPAGSCCIGFEIDLLQEFAARWFKDKNQVKFVTVTPTDGVEQLQSGTLDLLAASVGAISDNEVLDHSQPYYAGKQIQSRVADFHIPAYDHAFRDLINFTLQAMAVDGTYERLYTKWFPDEPVYTLEIWPGLPRDPTIQAMIQNESQAADGMDPNIENDPTVSTSPPLVTTATQTLTLPTPAYTLVPTVSPITVTLTPTSLPTIMPTATFVPIAIELSNNTNGSAPMIIPATGVSSRSLRGFPIVIMVIISLFSGAIYIRTIAKK